MPDHARHVEDAGDAVECDLERGRVEDVALDGLCARAVQAGRGLRGAHERPYLPVAAAQLADELGSEVAGRSGDQGPHRGQTTRGGAPLPGR